MYCISYWKEISDLLPDPPSCTCLGGLLYLNACLKLFVSPAPMGLLLTPQVVAIETLWIAWLTADRAGADHSSREGSVFNPETIKEQSSIWEVWAWSWYSGTSGFCKSKTDPASLQGRQSGNGVEGMPPRDNAGNFFSKGRTTLLLISSYSLVILATFLKSAWQWSEVWSLLKSKSLVWRLTLESHSYFFLASAAAFNDLKPI